MAGSGDASAQRRKDEMKFIHVTVHGHVRPMHSSLAKSGIRYSAWGLGKNTDTSISDANGAFTLILAPADRKNIKEGFRLGVRETGSDSLAWSTSDDIIVTSDTSVVELDVYRYPRATRVNGDLLKGNFYLPVLGRRGKDDLMPFLSAQLRYPDDARENGIEGKVIVRFIIGETGAIHSPEIMLSGGKALDTEVLRLVGNMPNWTPGGVEGQPTAMYFYLPITFRLD